MVIILSLFSRVSLLQYSYRILLFSQRRSVRIPHILEPIYSPCGRHQEDLSLVVVSQCLHEVLLFILIRWFLLRVCI